MVSAKSNDSIVIIRRPRASSGEHHGGSWKVAFADFAIAMMALFMVLWLIAATTPLQKKAIATYFSDPGLYNRTGTSTPIEMRGSTTLVDTLPVYLKPSPSGMTGLEISGKDAPGVDEAASVSTSVALALAQAARDGKAPANPKLTSLPKALLLSLTESDVGPMFLPGSTTVTPYYEDLLIAIAPVLRQLDLQLIISGHADNASAITNDDNRQNWQLSGDRAEAVREILTFADVRPEQIFQLSAMGDTLPLAGQEPESPLNRRVDILILTKKSAKAMRKRYVKKEQRIPEQTIQSAEKTAEDNVYPPSKQQ